MRAATAPAAPRATSSTMAFSGPLVVSTTAESPTIFANAGDSYHRTMSQEFDALWADATTAYRLEPSRPCTRERGSEPVKGHARASLFRRDDMAETTLRMRTTNERGFAIIRSVGQG